MTPRARDRERRDLGQQIEGRRAVRELLTAGTRQVHEVLVSADDDDLVPLAEAAHARVRRVPPDQLERRARTDAPQGVVAFAAPIEPIDIDMLLGDPSAFLVALDGVTDPQNLGAVMRTAETCGATGIVVPRHRAVGLTPTVAKAAAGAVEHLPVAFVSGIASLLERAARARLWCVGLDAGGDVSVFDLPVADQPLVLVLGAEGRGLSRLVRARCDLVAAIPMFGSIASLNVSAAAAIACAEIARRRAQ
ncbi:MAG TPA: 23S rRNA (guanosine(2251)-2'-O)-methyltransferase RlmB [Acidimicrobiia bacterium]|nr:23S rRNA (guanosine(2251)-2'-O)-methyltransferase RlmB [Acidimicrobiia bacterium]